MKKKIKMKMKTRKCKECDNELPSIKRSYCSDECQRDSKNRKMRITHNINCLVCDNKLPKGKSKFCTVKCRRENEADKQRDKRLSLKPVTIRDKKLKYPDNIKYRLREQFTHSHYNNRNYSFFKIKMKDGGEDILLDIRVLNNEDYRRLLKSGQSFLFELSYSEEKIRIKDNDITR